MLRVIAIVVLGVPGVALAQADGVDVSGFPGASSAVDTKPPAPGYVGVVKLDAGEHLAGRVTITRTKTAVELRAGTIIEVFAPRSPTSRAPDIINLVEGSARISGGTSGVRIDAAGVRTTAVNGDVRVSLFDDGVAISNHGELPVRVKVGNKGRSVPEGHGLTTRGGAEAIAELPATPAVVVKPPTGLSTIGAPFAAQVSAVAGVTAVAEIRAGDRPVAVFETTGGSFEGGGLGAGPHSATVWARGTSGLESRPSARVDFTVALIPVIEPGATEPIEATPAITDHYRAPALLPGTVLRRPDGDCAVGGEPACPELGFSVYQVSATLASEPEIAHDRPTELRIDVTTDAPDLDLGALRVQAGDAAVREIRPAAGHLAVSIQPLVGARSTSLTVALGAVTIGRFELAVKLPEPVTPQPPVVVKEPAAAGPTTAWELGGLIGVTVLDDENALGNAPSRDGVLDGGAVVGLRASYGFTSALGVEAEGTYSQPGFAELDDHANVLNYRVHGRVFLSEGRVRPFAVLGFGGTYLETDSDVASNDADIEGYWGLGARVAIDARKSVRLDLRHLVGPGRVETTSNVFEASLGISWGL